MKNRTGETYGCYKVVDFGQKYQLPCGDFRTTWLCKCLYCNTTKSVTDSCFRKKTISTKCRNCRSIEQSSHKGFGEITGSFWTKLKKNASSRGRDVLIDPDYAWELFLYQNRQCYFTGVDLYLPGAQSKHNKTNASLDRLNNTLSYVKGNVCWVDKSVNMMKGRLSPARFVEICRLVSENNTYESDL